MGWSAKRWFARAATCFAVKFTIKVLPLPAYHPIEMINSFFASLISYVHWFTVSAMMIAVVVPSVFHAEHVIGNSQIDNNKLRYRHHR